MLGRACEANLGATKSTVFLPGVAVQGVDWSRCWSDANDLLQGRPFEWICDGRIVAQGYPLGGVDPRGRRAVWRAAIRFDRRDITESRQWR
jgi:hypothetical protein